MKAKPQREVKCSKRGCDKLAVKYYRINRGGLSSFEKCYFVAACSQHSIEFEEYFNRMQKSVDKILKGIVRPGFLKDAHTRISFKEFIVGGIIES